MNEVVQAWGAVAAVHRVLARFDHTPDMLILHALYYFTCIRAEYPNWKEDVDNEDIEDYMEPPVNGTRVAGHLQRILTIGIVLAAWNVWGEAIWGDEEWLEYL